MDTWETVSVPYQFTFVIQSFSLLIDIFVGYFKVYGKHKEVAPYLKDCKEHSSFELNSLKR